MLYYHPAGLEHRQLTGHPECPERLSAIRARLEAEGLWRLAPAPAPATLAEVVGVHAPHYVDRLRMAQPGPYDMDTYLRPETHGHALQAAGTVLAAARAATPERPTLAVPRPPGHHAGPNYGGGFCYLNNVAIAAAALRGAGAMRVAIVDIDVHHGNGTADIFAADPTVLYCSTHGWPLFPGTGAADDTGEREGRGFTVNVPLPAGSGDVTYAAAMESVVMSALERFAPATLLVSLGGDAHWADPLAPLALSSAGYVAAMRALRDFAAARAIPLSVTLEGGYHLDATAEVVAATAAILTGAPLPALRFAEVRDADGAGLAAVERAVAAQRAAT